MLKANNTLVIDFFSGRPNPTIEITKEDFATLYEEVLTLEKAEPAVLFDGLGFRGFILSGPDPTSVFIQKNIIKIESLQGEQYRKNNPGIISKLVNLVKNYDKENNYEILIEKIIAEYL